MKLLNYLNKSENSIAILLAVAILSMCFPYGFPLFGVLPVFFVFLKLITNNFKLRINTGFILLFLSIIAYFIALLYSGTIYNLNKTDLVNIVSFLFIWVLLSDLKKEDYPKLIEKFAKYTVLVTLIVAVISLYKFYKLLGYTYIDYFLDGSFYPSGTALVSDYNMFSFSLATGLIMSLYLLNKTTSFKMVFFHVATSSVIFTSILFAGSRRGWVVALVILIFVMITFIKFLFRRRFDVVAVRLLKFGFFASYIIVFAFLVITLFNIDIDVQNTAQLEQMKNRFETLQASEIDSSFEPRTDRWDYSIELINQYNPIQLLIGTGFEYIPRFGDVYTSHSDESYPHNPFLSTLLYSGIIGLLIVACLFVLSVINIIKNREVFSMHFFFLYLIGLLFISISGNSIFSIKFFMLIVLIALSIPNKIHKQEKVLLKGQAI